MLFRVSLGIEYLREPITQVNAVTEMSEAMFSSAGFTLGTPPNSGNGTPCPKEECNEGKNYDEPCTNFYNLELDVDTPYLAIFRALGTPTSSGGGDTNVGVKWNFHKES